MHNSANSSVSVGILKVDKMLISALRSNRHLLTNEIHKQTGAVVFQETEFDFNLTRFFQHAHNWTLRIPVLQTLRQWFPSCVGTLHILSLLQLFYSPRTPRWLWEQTLLKMHLLKTKATRPRTGAAFSLELVLFLELMSAETIKASLFLSFMAYLRLVLLLCNKFGQRANHTSHKRQLVSRLSRALYEVKAHARPTQHSDWSCVVLGSRTHWTWANIIAWFILIMC